MLVRVVDVSQERRPEDAEGEEEAEGETEEDGGEDGVGDDHGVHVPAPALLLEHAVGRVVLEHGGLDGGGDGEHHGQEHDADTEPDVDLPLPLELRCDSGELQGDVAG